MSQIRARIRNPSRTEEMNQSSRVEPENLDDYDEAYAASIRKHKERLTKFNNVHQVFLCIVEEKHGISFE